MSLTNRVSFNISEKQQKEEYEKIKQQGKEFYKQNVQQQSQESLNELGDNLIEFSRIEQWQELIQESDKVLVLDCYADWCEPCKQLTSLLIEQLKKDKLSWTLVKINIDKFGQIAKALQIKSIPTVYLIYKGNAIDGLVGMPKQDQLEGFLKSIKKMVQLSEVDRIESQWPAQEQQIDELIKSLQFSQAMSLLNPIHSSPLLTSTHPIYSKVLIRFLYLQILINSTLDSQSQALYQAFNKDSLSQQEILYQQHIQKLIQNHNQLILQDQSYNQLLSQLQNSPNNLDLIFQISQKQIEFKLYKESIQSLLKIIKIDRNWEDKKAFNSLLQLFQQLGNNDQQVIEGRKLLQKMLY